jgi:hypothetical protein
MKKSLVLATTGAVILGIGLLTPTFVSAEGNGESFAYRLAQRLNLSEEEVDSAIQEVRLEEREERQSEREEAINNAVESGDLTERQQELLTTMHEIRVEERESEDFEPGEGRRNMGEMQEDMLESLNAEGLDVTEDELEDLRDTMQDLGLGGQGGNGMRMHMGR